MTKKVSKKFQPEFWLKLFLLAIVLLSSVKFLIGDPGQEASVGLDGQSDDRIAFAKCLMKSGLVMYGVDTCEYCRMQKKMFGRAFEEIRYVNCDFEKVCREKNITHYPVWETENRLIPGMQTFEKLAELSGCTIPNKISN